MKKKKKNENEAVAVRHFTCKDSCYITVGIWFTHTQPPFLFYTKFVGWAYSWLNHGILCTFLVHNTETQMWLYTTRSTDFRLKIIVSPTMLHVDLRYPHQVQNSLLLYQYYETISKSKIDYHHINTIVLNIFFRNG